MPIFQVPEPKPANVNYVNAFAKGYATPDAMEAPGLANDLTKQKIDLANRQMAAGQEYQQTGDINALSAYAPMEVAKVRAVEQKQDAALMVPRLKLAYVLGGGMEKPELFDQKRQMLVAADPWFDRVLPPTWSPEAAQWIVQQHGDIGKMLKAEVDKQNTMIWQNGQLVDTGTSGRVILGRETPDEVAAKAGARAEAVAPYRQSGGGGSSPARGKTGPQFQHEYFLQWQAKNPGKTKQDFDAATAELIGRSRAKGKEIGKMDAWESLGGGTSTTAPAPAATQKMPTQDYYESFKKALSGPNKAAAIKRSQELKDGYYERAQKEGSL